MIKNLAIAHNMRASVGLITPHDLEI